MNTLTAINAYFKKPDRNKFTVSISKGALTFAVKGQKYPSEVTSLDKDPHFLQCLNTFMTAGDIAHSLHITIRKAERVLHHDEKYLSKMPSVYHRFEIKKIQDDIHSHWFKFHNHWIKRNNWKFGQYKGLTVISKDTFMLFKDIFKSEFKKANTPLDKVLFNNYKYLNKKELMNKLIDRTDKLICLSSITHHFLSKYNLSYSNDVAYDYLFDHYRDCLLPKKVNDIKKSRVRNARMSLTFRDYLLKGKHLTRSQIGELFQSMCFRSDIIKRCKSSIKYYQKKLAINQELSDLTEMSRSQSEWAFAFEMPVKRLFGSPQKIGALMLVNKIYEKYYFHSSNKHWLL